jgi:hypothetical protein
MDPSKADTCFSEANVARGFVDAPGLGIVGTKSASRMLTYADVC